MKKIALFILALTIFIGCGQNAEKNAITKLEEQLESSKDPKDAEALLEAYNVYIEDNPEDMINARYLYRSASTMFRMNRFNTATEYLKRALKDYYASDNSAKAADLLAEIYDNNLNNKEVAATVRSALVEAFPNYEDIEKVKGKLVADSLTFDKRMQQLMQDIFNPTSGRVEYKKANNFVLNCELQAIINPQSDVNPTWLHRAAEAARSIKNYNKAIELYQKIYTDYPESERAAQAYFLHGFTLDNDLKKTEEAKTQYEVFLKKFPDNDFADDAQFLLDNLGKSEEELINSFQKK
jgi:tetratricopeptide (TPR) repeat protein